MQQIVLSDHVNEQLSAAQGARRAAFDEEMKLYHQALEKRKKLKAARHKRLSQAWAQGRFIAGIGAVMAIIAGMFSFAPRHPVLRTETGRNERVWRSGEEGERRVEQFFANFLSDKWTMLSGYHNPRGEIDQILVGPNGVFALEVKNLNGVVHCNGDHWWRDRYDRYGNQVSSGDPLSDRGGRSPSRQLNEPADRLASQLARRTGVGVIHRIVVLTHPRSGIGEMHNQRVNLVAVLHRNHPRDLLGISDYLLDSSQVNGVVKTIQEDHAYHRDRRGRSRRGN